MGVLAIPYHYEPSFKGVRVTDGSRRHGSRFCCKDFLDQDGSIGELARFAVGRDCAGRGIDIMDLLRSRALGGSDRPGAEELIGCAILGGHVKIAMSIGRRGRTRLAGRCCRQRRYPCDGANSGNYDRGRQYLEHDCFFQS